ncbi:MAG TPA: VWA domain-containing protein [Marmoricola sp.]|nr:VWA domain-containing protein [Marmoricola sp.]
MTLLDRHVQLVAALRSAGLPVSLAEDLDAVRAVRALDISDRETLRAALAATLVKRPAHRPAFDAVFDLFFPPLVGTVRPGRPLPEEGAERSGPSDGAEDLARFRERLAAELAGAIASDTESTGLQELAREAVDRFGLIRGRGPGEQRWSAYNVLNRVTPGELAGPRAAARFEALVETEVRRRAAELRGPEYVARHTVRPSIDQLDFTSARRADLEAMRREIQPLARRLATRLSREQRARGRGPLDFRRTIRASMSTGGVPVATHHRPRRPGRTDLVVLCDVSSSVASFAGFTLLLVFALHEQFHRVRAFTFVDEIHEVTDRFTIDADPGETLATLAASAAHATLWGRTNYGRAFTRFAEEYGDALTPRTNLLVLGDARSNYSDLALPVVRQLVHDARHAWWLNPEHTRHWDTGDSAASSYAAVVPMVECRNLTQLGEFVHGLA